MIYVWFNFVFVFAGVYVANRASDKITQLTDNVYVCRSGSVLFFLKQLTFIFVPDLLMVKMLQF